MGKFAQALAQQAQFIKNSGGFDEVWYLAAYPDVAEVGIDPVLHYLRWGARMARNPAPGFDTAYYLLTSPDVVTSGMNPFIHYLRYGKAEGRPTNASMKRTRGDRAPKAADAVHPAAGTTPARRMDVSGIKCTIVLPVYNAFDEALDCIHSVLRHTEIGLDNRLLVLDDHSPDPRMLEMLDSFAGIEGIDVVHNRSNLGYTGNVNTGCALAGSDDVVLLNSDTIVGPHWLRNLKQAAYQGSRVGTVTAVSNNAGAFSVPEPGTNQLPDGVDVDMAARAVADAVGATTIEVPTGNGFCLYIKRALIDEIGIFDIDAFPRGYGEENDFCMRAGNAGWSNVVAAGTYVFHVRSASFKDEKNTLIEEGVCRVKQRHPAYAGAIKAIGASPEFKRVRGDIDRALGSANRNHASLKPRIMFVVSTRTGGTPQTNRDLMNAIDDVYDCYALRCDRSKIEVLEADKTDYRVLKTYHLADPVTFATHMSREYDEIVRSILVEMSIDLLHIRHIAWHSLRLPEVARGVGIPVVNSFHDFYAVCPTVNLIDRDGVFSPTGVSENGNNPLWPTDVTALPITQASLEDWQARMQRAFSSCDAFVTTCDTARDLIRTALPALDRRSGDFHVIPHGRDFPGFAQLAVDEELRGNDALRVLLPGNIGLSKGKELVRKIKQLDSEGLIEFHVLGKCDPDLAPYVIDHGMYERDKFGSHVAAIRPHISAVLSIWPETYCHTLTESWACGLPVLGVAYGAVAERIAHHAGGWLAECDAAMLYAKLLEIRADRTDREEQTRRVHEWQRGYGLENTTARMSEQYLDLYQAVMASSRKLRETQRKRTAFVMKGRFPDVPPTAYVRLVDWKIWFEQEYGQPVDYIHWSGLLRSDLAAYSKVVIQRDAIPRERVDAVVAATRRLNVDFIYELDDDLFEVPHGADQNGVYRSYAHALRTLCADASQVHVTNSDLAKKCGAFNNNVVIRPNKISRSRWQLDRPGDAGEIAIFGSPPGQIKVLYFGSRTHHDDIEFVLDALKCVRDGGIDIKLFVAGGADNLRSDNELVERLSPPSSRYDHFVKWLVGISGNFNFGVAPLLGSDFSASKSYLKLIEYLAIGLPVICSDVMPYSDMKEKLGPGVRFAQNSKDVWIEHLIALAKDAEGCRPQPATWINRDFVNEW